MHPFLVHSWNSVLVTSLNHMVETVEIPRQLKAEWGAAVNLKAVLFLAQKLH